MQIELNNIDPNINRIIAYSDDYFKLANKVIHSNLVISKDNLCEDLLTDNFQDFALQHLKKIMLWKPELILIGTGKTLNCPNDGWVDYATKKNIHFVWSIVFYKIIKWERLDNWFCSSMDFISKK